jgi:hypothetical protein
MLEDEHAQQRAKVLLSAQVEERELELLGVWSVWQGEQQEQELQVLQPAVSFLTQLDASDAEATRCTELIAGTEWWCIWSLHERH